MTSLPTVSYHTNDINAIATATGHVAVVVSSEGRLGAAARRANKLTRGALQRLVESDSFAKIKPGQVVTFAFPLGMDAKALHVLVLNNRNTEKDIRQAGANLAKARKNETLALFLNNITKTHELVLALALSEYRFTKHKTEEEARQDASAIDIYHAAPEKEGARCETAMQVAEGVFAARDLTSEPANILNPTSYAEEIAKLSELGLQIEVLDDADMEKLGMGSFLSVGRGSAQPCKLVVMKWLGGEKDAAPLALVGKGVTFDTGGISLKPSAGMEEMTMDMGGSAVVVGTMIALAKRGARANVVGLVGLVENMPSSTATRPGDIVHSMKGDTIEIINTDAEGRLVLADVLWYAQETFKPCGVIDLATLTGAIIIGLGHENAGVFSNDDELCNKFLKSARSMGEGAWRLPIDAEYDTHLKSKLADMKNVGGRAAGSITASKFLQRFIQEDMPWIHIDIAGVAMTKHETVWSPTGVTGWGVLSLDHLVATHFESAESEETT